METLSIWKDMLTKPKETFEREKKNVNYKIALVSLLIPCLITALIFTFITSSVAYLSPSNYFLPKEPLLYSGLTLVLFLFVIAFVFVVSLFWILITNAGYFITARLLGGRGMFPQHVYLSAIIQPIILIAFLTRFIPYVNLIAPIAVFLYYIYLQVIAVREIYEISSTKALISCLLPLLLIFGLLTIASGFDFQQAAHADECPGFKRLSCHGVVVSTTHLMVEIKNTEDFAIQIKEIAVPEFDSCAVDYGGVSGLTSSPPGGTLYITCTKPKVPLKKMDKFSSEISMVYTDSDGKEYQDGGKLIGQIPPW
jgi:hypothetical protein